MANPVENTISVENIHTGVPNSGGVYVSHTNSTPDMMVNTANTMYCATQPWQ